MHLYVTYTTGFSSGGAQFSHFIYRFLLFKVKHFLLVVADTSLKCCSCFHPVVHRIMFSVLTRSCRCFGIRRPKNRHAYNGVDACFQSLEYCTNADSSVICDFLRLCHRFAFDELSENERIVDFDSFIRHIKSAINKSKKSDSAD